MVNFVEICNICARKAIINAAKSIINSDKMCRSCTDLNFGVTFFGTQCSFMTESKAVQRNKISSYRSDQIQHNCASV